jgi:DNA adenine methylase
MGHLGGKSRLAKRIVNMFPPNVDIYVEPFIGAGSVYLRKQPSKTEVISDTDRTIIDVWKDMKKVGDHVKHMKFVCSKKTFDEQKKLKTTDPVKRLFRNLYVKKFSFGGMGWNVKTAKYCKGKNEGQYIKKHAEKIKERLATTTILRQDWKKVVAKYDKKKNVLFYLDPPYSSQIAKVWTYKRMDAKHLINPLKHIKNKFILSFEDNPSSRKLFKNAGFNIRRLKTKYNVQPTKMEVVTELIVTNFPN